MPVSPPVTQVRMILSEPCSPLWLCGFPLHLGLEEGQVLSRILLPLGWNNLGAFGLENISRAESPRGRLSGLGVTHSMPLRDSLDAGISSRGSRNNVWSHQALLGCRATGPPAGPLPRPGPGQGRRSKRADRPFLPFQLC